MVFVLVGDEQFYPNDKRPNLRLHEAVVRRWSFNKHRYDETFTYKINFFKTESSRRGKMAQDEETSNARIPLQDTRAFSGSLSRKIAYFGGKASSTGQRRSVWYLSLHYPLRFRHHLWWVHRYSQTPNKLKCSFRVLETAMGVQINAMENSQTKYIEAIYEWVIRILKCFGGRLKLTCGFQGEQDSGSSKLSTTLQVKFYFWIIIHWR